MTVKYRLLITVIFLSVLSSSCSILLSSPRVRENPEDESAQITSIKAVAKDTSTAYVSWAWKSPPTWMDSGDWITEIKIEHSTVTYPEMNIPFTGQTFSRSDNWESEWTDLSSDKTHYFSLFMRDNDGNWHMPVRTRLALPGTVNTVSGRIYSTTGSVVIRDGSGATYNSSALDVNLAALAVIYLDFDEVYITDATLTIYISTLNIAGDIEIFSLGGFLPGDDSSKWTVINDGSLVNANTSVRYTVSAAGAAVINITDAARAAALTPWKAICIKSADGTADIIMDGIASAPRVTADLVE